MKVAHLSFAPFDSTAALVNALAGHVDLTLVIAQHGADYIGADLDERVDLMTFDLPRLRQPGRQLAMCRDLVARLKELDPDVIHIHEDHPYFNFALGRLADYPLVLTVHEPSKRGHPRHAERRPPRFVVDRAFTGADRLIVHGETVRAALEELGVDPDRIDVCGRAVPALAHERPGAEPDGRTVLFFGRIFPYKGIEHLIAAQPAISERVPDARIVIAGRGQPLDRYRALIHDAGRVELRGYHVPKRERDELFARASVVVLPYVFATTSAVIPIARLHRRPVVVTDVGGLPGAVEHGVDGLIVPPADPAALADAVAGLLEAPERARAMGEAGRRRQDAMSSPDVIAPETIAVYERAIAAQAHSLRSSKILASLSR